MNATTRIRFARGLGLWAGWMDTAAGTGLLLAPAWTLALMQVPPPPPPPEATVFVRFIGAFVFAVGATYLFGVVGSSAVRLRHLLQFTLFPRAAAGGFVTCALVSGWLAWPWASVAVTDLGLVAVQGWLLAHEPRNH